MFVHLLIFSLIKHLIFVMIEQRKSCLTKLVDLCLLVVLLQVRQLINKCSEFTKRNQTIFVFINTLQVQDLLFCFCIDTHYHTNKKESNQQQIWPINIHLLSIIIWQQKNFSLLQPYNPNDQHYKFLNIQIHLIFISPAELANMEDLSLILASKQLFLSLSTQKVKTLKQAQELNKQHRNQKIQNLLSEYQNTKQKVITSIKSQNSKPWKKINLKLFHNDPLKYYMQGAKGSGKTALLLNLLLQYHFHNPQHTIKILNCAGGITMPRFYPFTKIQCEYCDVFGVQDLLQILQRVKNDKKVGVIAIDSQANLLLGYQKQKIGLGELIILLRDMGWSIYFTNYTQSRLQIDQKQATNPMGYFPQIFGGISQCKLVIEPQQQSEDMFKITMVKSLDSKYYFFSGKMNEGGFKAIQLVKKG